mmetsp:Transcript_50010/g.128947  ORF Transcript_50010/g.128947 Transcript_50010/m.128947 type:complete len:353 (+) Transcript_50010:71-1129(+)
MAMDNPASKLLRLIVGCVLVFACRHALFRLPARGQRPLQAFLVSLRGSGRIGSAPRPSPSTAAASAGVFQSWSWGRGLPPARLLLLLQQALPLTSEVPGVERLSESDTLVRTPAGGLLVHAPNGGDFEAVLPEEEDLEGLADLMLESFERVFITPRLLDEAWGPLGSAWKGIVEMSQRSLLCGRFQKALEPCISKPSLLRPRDQSYRLGMLLRQVDGRGVSAGEGAEVPAAYLELLLLPPDGRRPINPVVAFEELAPGETVGGDGSEPAPYLLNLCVSRELRGQGLGRAVLRFAEQIVQEAWGDRELFLHTDKTEAPWRLYSSAGYEPQSWNSRAELGVRYMKKCLGGPSLT